MRLEANSQDDGARSRWAKEPRRSSLLEKNNNNFALINAGQAPEN